MFIDDSTQRSMRITDMNGQCKIKVLIERKYIKTRNIKGKFKTLVLGLSLSYNL